jgi:type I restriction enzyme, S subunit
MSDPIHFESLPLEALLIDRTLSYGVVQPGTHVDDGVPIIRVNNVRNGRIDTTDIMRVDPTIALKHKRTSLSGGELLITVVGALGETAVVPSSMAGWNTARAVAVANVDPGIVDIDYLRYCFKLEDIKHQIYGNANTTVQPTLNLAELKRLNIPICSLPEQRRIAEVLSSLDDKIDLLHQQNQTLEQMAETLYRQWFDENDGDSRVTLGELASVSSGKSLNRADYIDDGLYPVIGSNGEIGRTNSYLIDRQVLVTGRVGTLGKVFLHHSPFWPSDNTLVIEPVSDGWLYGLYFYLKGVDYASMNVGSTQPLLTQTTLKQLSLTFTADNVGRFAEFCMPVFAKVHGNASQIRSLQAIRDKLLPKLMSGVIRVATTKPQLELV